jgi:hypothetical protein
MKREKERGEKNNVEERKLVGEKERSKERES